jgi:UDP-GlcNAc3NAcA epimerase
MINLLTIIGARPQFIKAAVLSRFIRDNPSYGISETILHTGQHYDYNMSDVFFHEMNIPMPDLNLHVGSGNHGKTTGLMLERIEEVILERNPDIVLVYGDTNSTLAGALTASKLHVPVAHVEAGLRSFMMIMPEEQNRRLTDHLSTWLFCPTQTAIDNLINEGIANSLDSTIPSSDKKCVALTGDIMYEASLYYRNKSNIEINDKNFILVTIHRAENTDDPIRLSSIVNAINDLSDYKFIFPIHPRTRKILEQQNITFASHVKIIEPVGYLEMIAYEAACSAVLTDSGGIQKEAFFFHKPCITMRDSTEWIELVSSGWNTLTGADSEKIKKTVKNMNTPEKHPNLYGDGKCAEKICDLLVKQ